MPARIYSDKMFGIELVEGVEGLFAYKGKVYEHLCLEQRGCGEATWSTPFLFAGDKNSTYGGKNGVLW